MLKKRRGNGQGSSEKDQTEKAVKISEVAGPSGSPTSKSPDCKGKRI